MAINGYEENELSTKAKTKTQNDISDNNRKIISYGDVLGWGFLNGSYALGHWLFGSNASANLMVTASFYSTFLTLLLKYTVRERRPNGEDRLSFPSGHTSLAFAFGTVVAIEHPWYVGILGLGIASFIGYSRIVNNAHWLHDVVGGMTIGASYALGIASTSRGGSLSILPMPTIDSPGMQLKIAYHF